MRNYQRKYNNPYRLPQPVYMQVLYKLKDYPRLCQQYQDIVNASPAPPDGMPGSSAIGDPTAQKAAALEAVSADLHAIEQAAMRVRGEYSNRMTETTDPIRAYNDYAYFCTEYTAPRADAAPCERTWRYYRARLVYYIAQNLHLI